jgi:phosphoadenosine phosphosulfate reductase
MTIQLPQNHLSEISLLEKVAHAKAILAKALKDFGVLKVAVAITGGKDSTTTLWLLRQVCHEVGLEIPVCVFIDEGDVFDEIKEFVQNLEVSLSLKIARLRNDDAVFRGAQIGGMIEVSGLNEVNRAALQEIDYQLTEFPFLPDSVVCNHLLKTIPLRTFLVQQQIKALITGIRRDECGARQEEEFFSQRSNPDHMRVHPILHFRERDIWEAIFTYNIPYNPLYALGYRSLGARCATFRDSEIPAWRQDLDNTPERVGRGQEKEATMEHLRALGYM